MRRIGLFLIIVAILIGTHAWAATVELPKTGITFCCDDYGFPVPCAGTGQDGEIQAGVAWPSPRFTVSGDCITDNLSGLTWVKSVPTDSKTFDEALAYADTLKSAGLCGHGDWRVPNINEILSLSNPGASSTVDWLKAQGFENIAKDRIYWSSTMASPGISEPYTLEAFVVLVEEFGLFDRIAAV